MQSTLSCPPHPLAKRKARQRSAKPQQKTKPAFDKESLSSTCQQGRWTRSKSTSKENPKLSILQYLSSRCLFKCLQGGIIHVDPLLTFTKSTCFAASWKVLHLRFSSPFKCHWLTLLVSTKLLGRKAFQNLQSDLQRPNTALYRASSSAKPCSSECWKVSSKFDAKSLPKCYILYIIYIYFHISYDFIFHNIIVHVIYTIVCCKVHEL